MQDAEPPVETRAPEPESPAYELPPLVLASIPEREQPIPPAMPEPPAPPPPPLLIEAPKSSAELIAPTVVATAPPPPPAPPPAAAAIPAAVPAAAPRPLERGRWWTVCSHLLLFAVIPTVFLGGVVTFFLWQILGKDDPFVEDQTREALNFQINVAVLSLVLAASIFGLPLVIVLWVIACIMCLVAAMHAARGERYRYPLIFRVVTH